MWLHRRAAHLLLLLSVLVLPVLSRGQPSGGNGTVPGDPCAVPTRVMGSETLSQAEKLLDVADTLYFVRNNGSDSSLWMAQGTANAVELLPSSPGWGSTDTLNHLTAVGNKLFFTVDRASSTELWTSDGSTVDRLKSFSKGGVGDQSHFTAVGSTLFFAAAEGTQGFELWRSDGTSGGTVLVQNIRADPEGSNPSELVAMGGWLFFAADDGIHGNELWKSNGTQTAMVQDIWNGGSSSPSSLRVMDGMLYFTATDGSAVNAALWRSNGAGLTERVFNLATAAGRPEALTVAGSQLFFVLKDTDHDEEVWVRDGTSGSTHLVADIQQGPYSSTPRNLTAVGGQLFFMANDSITGPELWRSDGSLAGTRLVKEFVPGSTGPSDSVLLSGAGVLLVEINDSVSGRSLWKSDGVGTVRLTGIAPPAESSTRSEMTISGGRLFFVAYDPQVGAKVLFVLPLNQVDCFKPVLLCPGDLQVEAASSNGSYFSVPYAVFDDAVVAPSVTPEPQSLARVYPLGNTHLTIEAKDGAGNSKSCEFNVNVQDTTPPLLLCPKAIVQEATEPAGAMATYFVAASDAVASNLHVSYSHQSGIVFPVGTTNVNVTASDGVSTSTCQIPLTIQDTVKPSLTCPGDQVFQADQAEPKPVPYTYQADDAVTPKEELSLITDHPPGSAFPVGETHVTLTVKDKAGNASEPCSFWVKNLDLTPPTITCPGPQQVATSSSEGTEVRFQEAKAEDNLGEVHVSYSPEPGSRFPVGETVVTATATDAGQRTASCTFTVTVVQQAHVAGSCQAGASGGVVGWLVLVLVPLWARRRAERGAR
ncbi:ELWxxDGT repeat protein [Hyalangium versicolor]|uniref:ELWxxDGT repeat protein n=1 Tax=Hyalangium versicolor TaxID=2861190 RepID=UPI001CCF3301|nr:ELWxxDGT repeat protein [Hyalangium versicolor]